MDEYNKHKKKTRVNVWLVIGALILIALLIIWLTIADLWGDTDVAAQATGAVLAICNNFLT